MGRGRVQLKRIENKINRQVTFSKRRAGLLKKAREISVLCDADVAIIIFSTKGRLFEYSTDERMDGILESYERCSNAEKQVQESGTESTAQLKKEYAKLNARLEVLQRNQRLLMEEDLNTASLRELHHLEQQLDSALKNIRRRENHLMNESISELRKKEKALKEHNDLLHNKLKEEKVYSSSSSSSIQIPTPYTPPYLQLWGCVRCIRSSCNEAGKRGEILQAAEEEPQSFASHLPPWMLRALN